MSPPTATVIKIDEMRDWTPPTSEAFFAMPNQTVPKRRLINVRAPTLPRFMGMFLICDECCLCKRIKYCEKIERAMDEEKVILEVPSLGLQRLAVVSERPLRQMSDAK